MTVRIKSTGSRLRHALMVSLAAAVLFGTNIISTADAQDAHAAHAAQTVSAKLVDIVRMATSQFIDVNVATAANYKPAFGCVTGPDHGAMGIHYVNGALVGDGVIDANRPEALIYEPTPSGLKLVGVEYIVDAATWMANHDAPPSLENQAFQFVNAPNRYGLPAFFELHVWAWRDNPNGAFVDWNTKVSCEGQ